MNKRIMLSLLMLLFIFMALPMIAAQNTAEAPLKISLLNQIPDPAKAGNVVEVRIRVQNIGSTEAREIIVEPVLDYPFTLLPQETSQKKIEVLPNWPVEESSKTLLFKFRVDREASEGQYEIDFRHSVDGGISWKISTFNLDVLTREFAEIIYIDKTKLLPGTETEMTFTITNIGNAPLQNLKFSWNEPQGVILPVGTDDTRYIKYMEPGESVPLKYTLIASVNANPDLYKLELTLQYDVKNDTGELGKETVTTKAGVFVGGETDFDVTFSESSQGTTSLSVANVGVNPALSVTVRIPDQEEFSVTGSKDAIVGNLDKGDYTIVSFQIARTQNFKAGNMQELSQEERQQLREKFQGQAREELKVFIDYTDTTGARQSLEKTVPIQFRLENMESGNLNSRTGAGGSRYHQQGSVFTMQNALIFVVIIIFGLGAYFYVKNRKK